jgi:hypothetical protein
MEAVMAIWNPKPPESVEFFSVDAIRQLAPGDRIEACTALIEAIKGEDPDVDEMLVGAPEINGSTVAQKVQCGIWGCRYKLTFTILTLFGETLKVGGDFYVGTEAPGSRDLTTLQAVKDWLGVKGAGNDALLQRLITAESQMIEKLLQRPVLAETRTDFVQGYGSATVMPPATPIQAIEKVLIDGAEIKVCFDYLTIWRADGRHWPRRARIQITYTAGYESVPFDLEQACIELVALHYAEREHVGHQSKSLGGETVSFITRAIPHSVEARIAPYKKVAPC